MVVLNKTNGKRKKMVGVRVGGRLLPTPTLTPSLTPTRTPTWKEVGSSRTVYWEKVENNRGYCVGRGVFVPQPEPNLPLRGAAWLCRTARVLLRQAQ